MAKRNHNDDIILVGTKHEYYIYYDHRNNQSFMMMPSHRITRCFGHCGDSEIAAWAENHMKKYLESLEQDKYRSNKLEEVWQARTSK